MKLPPGAKILSAQDGMTLVELPQHPKRRYPLWDIEALRKDQEHAQDKIDSFTEAIEDLQKLIAERQEQIATCEERDREIAAWERKYGNAQLRAG